LSVSLHPLDLLNKGERLEKHGFSGALQFWQREHKSRGWRETLNNLIQTHYPESIIVKSNEDYAKYTKEDWESLIKEIADKYKNGNMGEVSTDDFQKHGFNGALLFWKREHKFSGGRETLNNLIQTHYPESIIVKSIEDYAKYTKEDWESLIQTVSIKYRNGNIGEITTSDFQKHGFNGALLFWKREHKFSGGRESLNNLIQTHCPDTILIVHTSSNDSFNQAVRSAVKRGGFDTPGRSKKIEKTVISEPPIHPSGQLHKLL